MSTRVKLVIVSGMILVEVILRALSGDSLSSINLVLFIPIWIAATITVWLAAMRNEREAAEKQKHSGNDAL